ncbi:MAG TPA: AzlD domain-containing protein [Longimicrobiales bacterium]|jgi:branched-subunit amino acid transport protein
MSKDLIIVAVAVGLGTWLFRFLPTRLGRSPALASGRLAGAMEAVGPAAITTLLIASVLPDLAAGGPERTAVLVGCGVTGVTYAVTRNVVVATLIGALAYGLV